MSDVHEVYVDKRRSRAGPIIVLMLVCLLLIGVVVAMVMNVHGSISWPAGELKFGFWPQTTSVENTAPDRVATNVTVAIPPPTSESDDARQRTPSVESNTPAETEPAPVQ
jgi:hypothetical protein